MVIMVPKKGVIRMLLTALNSIRDELKRPRKVQCLSTALLLHALLLPQIPDFKENVKTDLQNYLAHTLTEVPHKGALVEQLQLTF
jgi:hypothetical protein